MIIIHASKLGKRTKIGINGSLQHAMSKRASIEALGFKIAAWQIVDSPQGELIWNISTEKPKLRLVGDDS